MVGSLAYEMRLKVAGEVMPGRRFVARFLDRTQTVLVHEGIVRLSTANDALRGKVGVRAGPADPLAGHPPEGAAPLGARRPDGRGRRNTGNCKPVVALLWTGLRSIQFFRAESTLVIVTLDTESCDTDSCDNPGDSTLTELNTLLFMIDSTLTQLKSETC